MDKPTALPTCDLQAMCRLPVRMGQPILAALVLLAFAAGFAVRGWLGQRPDHRADDMEAFLRHLSLAADLKIVEVDRWRLDEAICVVAEAEWEDRQAQSEGQ